MTDKGQNKETQITNTPNRNGRIDDFVLEKSIFSNIFNKDIKRVFIYKKAERLAKALHLVSPAFAQAPSLAERLNGVSIAIVDAAVVSPADAKSTLARELLTLSSLLSIARTGGLLSPMNADLIGKEAQYLLEEVASYEAPRVLFEETSTLAELHRAATQQSSRVAVAPRNSSSAPPRLDKGQYKTDIKDSAPDTKKANRREAVLSVLRAKGPSYIKDISTVVRDVSEKTIQRELQGLVEDGVVVRSGERRWTTYSLES